MRLSDFLNEETDYKKIFDECKPYIELLRRENMMPFVKGMIRSAAFGVKNVRKDRIPQGTRYVYFKVLNAWMKKHGHAPRNESVITTYKSKHAASFGTPYFIFPIGEFKYTWCPSMDFNFGGNWAIHHKDFMTLFSQMFIRGHSDKKFMEKEVMSFLDQWGEQMFTTNRKIQRAAIGGYETWFECDRYFYFAMDYGITNNLQDLLSVIETYI